MRKTLDLEEKLLLREEIGSKMHENFHVDSHLLI